MSSPGWWLALTSPAKIASTLSSPLSASSRKPATGMRLGFRRRSRWEAARVALVPTPAIVFSMQYLCFVAPSRSVHVSLRTIGSCFCRVCTRSCGLGCDAGVRPTQCHAGGGAGAVRRGVENNVAQRTLTVVPCTAPRLTVPYNIPTAPCRTIMPHPNLPCRLTYQPCRAAPPPTPPNPSRVRTLQPRTPAGLDAPARCPLQPWNHGLADGHGGRPQHAHYGAPVTPP